MKNLHLLLLFLSTQSLAQISTFTTATPIFKRALPESMRIHTDESGISVYTQQNYTAGYYRYDLTGHQKFSSLWEIFDQNDKLVQINRQGDQTYTLFNEASCDIGSLGLFRSLDSVGLPRWMYSTDVQPCESAYFVPATHQNWWYWCDGQQPQLISDSTGLPIGSLPALRPGIVNYLPMPDGQTLTYGPSGLLRYNGEFEQTGSVLDSIDISDMIIWNDQILAYGAGKLWLIDLSLSIVAEADMSSQLGIGQVQLTAEGNRIFVARMDAPLARWYELGPSLQVLHEGAFPDQSTFQPLAFSLLDNHWLVAGNNPNQVIALKSVAAPYPEYQHQMDIALENIAFPDSFQVLFVVNTWGNTTYQANNVQFTVRNNSPIAIDYFRLNWYKALSWPICYSSNENNFDFNVFIAPDDTAVVTLPSISWSYFYAPNNLPPFEFRAWVDLPQDSLDAVPTNNELLVSIPVFVSTDDIIAPSAVRMWPNPATDEVNIEVAEPLFDIQLFDPLGRMVHEAYTKSGTYRWQRDGLPVGVYSVRIQAGQRTGVYRLVLH
jgi:Secretion system C-terminal sorting domain